jgi:hypothetical protein
VTHGESSVCRGEIRCFDVYVVSLQLTALAETKNFIYFYLGPIAILLWKTS